MSQTVCKSNRDSSHLLGCKVHLKKSSLWPTLPSVGHQWLTRQSVEHTNLRTSLTRIGTSHCSSLSFCNTRKILKRTHKYLLKDHCPLICRHCCSMIVDSTSSIRLRLRDISRSVQHLKHKYRSWDRHSEANNFHCSSLRDSPHCIPLSDYGILGDRLFIPVWKQEDWLRQ